MQRSKTSAAAVTALVSATACVLVTGCGSAADEKANRGELVPTSNLSASLGAARSGKLSDGAAAGIYGTVLYTKTYSSNHEVVFIELVPGVAAIAEQASIDSDVPVLQAALKAAPAGSLADIYRQLNPTAQSIPQSIEEADRRLAITLAKQGAEGTQGAPKIVAPSRDARRITASGISQAATGWCSFDRHEGEAWGAQWFRNNFCNVGGFRVCLTNQSGYDTGRFQEKWWQYTQMEGDWNQTGSIQVWHDQGLFIGWHLDAWHDIQPRQMETWSCSGCGGVEIIGSSQCGHEHASIGWNQ
jgi:hypothetical protein